MRRQSRPPPLPSRPPRQQAAPLLGGCSRPPRSRRRPSSRHPLATRLSLLLAVLSEQLLEGAARSLLLRMWRVLSEVPQLLGGSRLLRMRRVRLEGALAGEGQGMWQVVELVLLRAQVRLVLGSYARASHRVPR